MGFKKIKYANQNQFYYFLAKNKTIIYNSDLNSFQKTIFYKIKNIANE